MKIHLFRILVAILSITSIWLGLFVVPAQAAVEPPGNPDSPPGRTSWTPASQLPAASYLAAGATADGCVLYSIGGFSFRGFATDHVFAHDPQTDTWSTGAPMPQDLGGLQAAAIGDLLYVVGGYRGDLSIADTNYIYDTAADAWSSGAPLPNPGGIATAAEAAYNGKVYVFGGDDGDSVSNDTTYEYDPATDTWASRAPMPTNRENNVAVTLNGKIYVAGGVQVETSLDGLTTFEAYDPVADSWTSLAPMDVGRISPGIATDGTYIYVYGGSRSYEIGRDLRSAERYDPMTNTWSRIPAMGRRTNGMAAGYVYGRLYSAGGSFTQANEYLEIGPKNCG